MAGVRHNLVSSVFSSGVNVVGQLALVPLYLTMWGEHRYGEWLVLFSVPSALALAELGLNNAFANEFVIAIEGREVKNATRMASSVWWFELIAFSGLVVLLGGAAFALPMAQWMELTSLGHYEFGLCVSALALYSAATVIGGFFSGYYRAAGKNPEYVNENTVFRVIELSGLSLILLTGGGMVAASLSIAAVRLFQVAWFGWRSARILPQFGLQMRLFSFHELRRLAPSGFAFFAYSSGNAVINQGAVLAVQGSMGPIAVVHFNVARQLGRVFLQLMGLVFSSVHPEMNLAFARRDFVRMASLQARALTPLLWFSPIVILLVYCLGPYAVHLWTHGKVLIAPTVLALFSVDALAYGISGTALLAAWSSNRHIGPSVTFLFFQACALGLGAWCLQPFGIAAMAVCFTTASVLQTILAGRVSARIVGQPSAQFWASAAFDRGFVTRMFLAKERT